MSVDLLVAISMIFISVAVVTGSVASLVLSRTALERRRLLGSTSAKSVLVEDAALEDAPSGFLRLIAQAVPKSPKEMSRLRRRLTTAGYRSYSAALVFSAAQIVVPLVFAVAPLLILGISRGWIYAALAGALGFLLPGVVLARKTALRKKAIRNGLPDALDLLVVCLEAGCGLDQAIVKASEELDVSHPALADELRLVTTETRAGKPRLDALKNFAARTKVDDVRELVAMLVQTDRFGTSVAQALRTHADVSRTKRRQRAEERAQKIGVKLVFPLVFCLFPAFYVVILGPAVIKFVRVFMGVLNR